MNFTGVLQVWEVAPRKSWGPIFDNFIIKALRSRGPGLPYDSQYPFDCYRLTIMMKRTDPDFLLPGYLIHVSGSIKTFNIKQGDPGEKWGIALECRAEDVKVIGMSEISSNPKEHIRATGSNNKGITVHD